MASLCAAYPSPVLRRRARVGRNHLRLPAVRCAAVEGSSSMPEFLRFQMREDDAAGPSGELQTAIVSYRKSFPWSILSPFLQVDLVSTIHVADEEYFEALKTMLEPYDCVLYEMVASRESLEKRKNKTRLKKTKTSHPKAFDIIGFLQRQISRFLSLQFQLDCIDYQNEKWCHADLDIETFESLQAEKGENLFTFARDVTIRSTESLIQPSIPENLDLDTWRSKLLRASRLLPMPFLGLFIIESLCTPPDDDNGLDSLEVEALSRLDFGAAMKIFLARQLTSEFSQFASSLGEDSVIVGERNKVAMKAIREAISRGERKIAVLYGGGHMPDLGRRLEQELDMVPSKVQWLTAWMIKNREPDRDSLPFLGKLAEMSGWPLNRYETLALLIFSSVLALDLWLWELCFGTFANWVYSVTPELGMYADNLQIH